MFFFMLLDMGALSLPAVANGEWGRIFMANLLHGNFGSLILNAGVLGAMSMTLERYLGSWRVLVILLLSCLGGSALTLMILPASVVTGVSSGLFGLVFAFIYLYWTQKEALIPSHQNLSKRVHLGGLAYFIFMLLLTDPTSLWPMIGGSIVGPAVTHLLVGSSGGNPDHRSNLVRAVAIGLSALFLAGSARCLIQFSKGDGAQVRRGWLLEQKRIAADDLSEQYALLETVFERGKYLEDVDEYREMLNLSVQNTLISGESIEIRTDNEWDPAQMRWQGRDRVDNP